MRLGWRVSSSSSACALSTLAKPGGGVQELCNAGPSSALSREAYGTKCRGLWQNSRDTVGECIHYSGHLLSVELLPGLPTGTRPEPYYCHFAREFNAR